MDKQKISVNNKLSANKLSKPNPQFGGFSHFNRISQDNYAPKS